MIDIGFAQENDLEDILTIDNWLDHEKATTKIRLQEIIIMRQAHQIIGMLRFSYFWDQIPFINLLWIEPSMRNQRCGTQMLTWFEEHMKHENHRNIMTSSLASESGQHFFRKQGFEDCGSLLIEKEGTEIVFKKTIKA